MELSCEIGYTPDCPVAKIENLPLHPSSLVSIVGENGTGKSTLYRTLIGDIPPLSGSIPDEVRLNTAIVSDYVGIPGDVLLDDLLDLLDSKKLAHAKKQFKKIAQIVCSLAHRKIASLSSGQKRIAQVFIMLAAGRRIIIMDEACAHLDYKNKSIVFKALADIVDGGATVLYTTHDLEDICQLDGPIYFFANKTLCQYGGKRTTQGIRAVLEREDDLWKS